MMSQNGIMLFKATFNGDGTLESIDLLFRNVWVLKYISIGNFFKLLFLNNYRLTGSIYKVLYKVSFAIKYFIFMFLLSLRKQCTIYLL